MPTAPTATRPAAPAARAAALLAVPAGVVAVVVFGVTALVWSAAGALVLAVAAGAAVAWWAWSQAEPMVLAAVGARPADSSRGAGEVRLVNLAEGLSFASGVAVPALYVVDDPARNAMAVGRGRQASVVVTSGLLEDLARIELEGVLAHELAHVKRGDVPVATLAAATVGLPALLCDLAGVAAEPSLSPPSPPPSSAPSSPPPPSSAPSSPPPRVARVLAPVLSPLAPASARAVARLAGPRREPVADLDAVSVTRYPPGLIAALEKVRGGDVAVARGARSTAHLWLAPPGGGPSVEERIQALREL